MGEIKKSVDLPEQYTVKKLGTQRLRSEKNRRMERTLGKEEHPFPQYESRVFSMVRLNFETVVFRI